MQIFVNTLMWKPIHLYVDPSDTIYSIKAKVQDKEGIPLEQQHLILNHGARTLEDACTLSDSNIVDGSVIHLMFMGSGRRSTSTLHDISDPLIQFLMMPDEERAGATIPINQLQAKAKSEDASKTKMCTFVKDCDILSEKYCELLCAFLEFM
jgi:hypothetical protein